MKPAFIHKKGFRTALGCLALYAVIFCGANFNVLLNKLETVTAPEAAPVIIDHEALADYEYFNSPAVERAMSLNDEEPMKVQTGGVHQMAI